MPVSCLEGIQHLLLDLLQFVLHLHHDVLHLSLVALREYHFHTQSIYFIDHSPGNTLIRREGERVHFMLVDLNRIKFMTISPLVGLKNFYRLNATDDMIDIIADEYARLTHSDAMEMTRLLKEWTHAHDEQVFKRKAKKKS